jgi:hypothetical protein
MSLHARITRRPKGNLGAPNLPAADHTLEWVRPAWGARTTGRLVVLAAGLRLT